MRMIPNRKPRKNKRMSYLKGIRSVIFPTRDLQASITIWTQVLGKAPAYQTPDFAVYNDGANEVGLSQAPWVDHPLVFWNVEDIEEAHRTLVASGAKAMGEIAGGSVAELGQPQSPTATQRRASLMFLVAASRPCNWPMAPS